MWYDFPISALFNCHTESVLFNLFSSCQHSIHTVIESMNGGQVWMWAKSMLWSRAKTHHRLPIHYRTSKVWSNRDLWLFCYLGQLCNWNHIGVWTHTAVSSFAQWSVKNVCECIRRKLHSLVYVLYCVNWVNIDQCAHLFETCWGD